MDTQEDQEAPGEGQASTASLDVGQKGLPSNLGVPKQISLIADSLGAGAPKPADDPSTHKFDMGQVLGQLRGDEGLRLVVYDDESGLPLRAGMVVRGNPTVGIGRNLADRGISEMEARVLLANDVEACAAQLDAEIPWWRTLSPTRQAQLINLDFNMGWGRLVDFKNFLAEMEAGNWVAAVAALKSSHWWNQVGRRGPEIAEFILDG